MLVGRLSGVVAEAYHCRQLTGGTAYAAHRIKGENVVRKVFDKLDGALFQRLSFHYCLVRFQHLKRR
jgi:hypothetical protein